MSLACFLGSCNSLTDISSAPHWAGGLEHFPYNADTSELQPSMSTMFNFEELTKTVLQAAQNLSVIQKADFLLQTSLSMIDSGRYVELDIGRQSVILIVCRYGEDVEHYLEVFLATPGISQEQISKALIARGSARRIAADRLLTRAHQGGL